MQKIKQNWRKITVKNVEEDYVGKELTLAEVFDGAVGNTEGKKLRKRGANVTPMSSSLIRTYWDSLNQHEKGISPSVVLCSLWWRQIVYRLVYTPCHLLFELSVFWIEVSLPCELEAHIEPWCIQCDYRPLQYPGAFIFSVRWTIIIPVNKKTVEKCAYISEIITHISIMC